ncbi:MAG: ribosome-associated translation inhibitor RaiA [Pseudomonadota bacterium]
MRIEITGKQIDLGDAQRERLTEKVGDLLDKFSLRATEARITVSRDAHFFVCDCQAHLSMGLIAKASARDSEAPSACDQALAKLEKQLRRHKKRLRDHHQRRPEPVELAPATAYVLQSEAEESGAATTDATEAKDLWSPAIIAESPATIPSLSVGEAVMQMELGGAGFLLFKNDARGRLNVVYQRDDGTIGWIDPQDAG